MINYLGRKFGFVNMFIAIWVSIVIWRLIAVMFFDAPIYDGDWI